MNKIIHKWKKMNIGEKFDRLKINNSWSGWKFGNIAESYIESSAQSKTLIEKQILTDNGNNENDASTSKDETSKTIQVSVVGNRNNEFLITIP